jgi:hypothetical protein
MARRNPRRSLVSVPEFAPTTPPSGVSQDVAEPRLVAIEPVAPAPGRIAVLVAEPHAGLREALVSLLRQEPDLDVASARQWSEVTHAIRRRPPDVGDDERAIATIRSMSAGTAVVLTGMQNSAQFSPSALRWGASGYLPLDSRPEEFLAAIDAAAGRPPGGRVPPDICA